MKGPNGYKRWECNLAAIWGQMATSAGAQSLTGDDECSRSTSNVEIDLRTNRKRDRRAVGVGNGQGHAGGWQGEVISRREG